MKPFVRQRIAFVVILSLLVFYAPGVSAKYRVTCKSVIFSDSTKVKRLYGKRVHDRILPASTAKVMTALLVMEHLSLNDYVTVSSNATKAQPSKLYLKPGEQYKVKDLLYAILLKSANDAAIVLAEAVAGSHWKFVQMMNKKAKEIKCLDTKFANSNGLPSKEPQWSTAYDIYVVFLEALKYPFFRSAIKAKYKTIYSKSGRKLSFKSHNKILFFDHWNRKLYGKTGYTRAAKACFVGTLKKGKSDLIIAVFGCKKRWDDIRHVVSRYGNISI